MLVYSFHITIYCTGATYPISLRYFMSILIGRWIYNVEDYFRIQM